MTQSGSALKLVTIGVYGFTPEAFFETLRLAGVDTFCDVRWRRGVRGHEYAQFGGLRLTPKGWRVLKGETVRASLRAASPAPTAAMTRLVKRRR